MGYLYEVHLHTKEGSRCGKASGLEYIPYFKDRGYDGIFITNHFYLGNTCIDRSLPWNEWVRGFCRGYDEAREAGIKAGLKVFFGWETTYDGDDFLIYGLDEAYLLRHPEILKWDQTVQFEEVKKAGGLVVQAHPYRSRGYIHSANLHPWQCDAWEIANAGNDPYENTLARDFAKAHALTVTCGSDMHWIYSDEEIPYAMETDEPLESAQDYVRLILSGKGWKLHIPENAYNETPHDLGIPILLYDQDNALIGECV